MELRKGDGALIHPDPLSFSLSGTLTRMGLLGMSRLKCENSHADSTWADVKEIGNVSLLLTGVGIHTSAEFIKAKAVEYQVLEKLLFAGKRVVDGATCGLNYSRAFVVVKAEELIYNDFFGYEGDFFDMPLHFLYPQNEKREQRCLPKYEERDTLED
jgi:hypothetical protein